MPRNQSTRTIFYLPPEIAQTPINWLAIGEDDVRTTRYNWEGEKRDRQGLLWQSTIAGTGRIDIGNRKRIPLTPASSFLAFLPSDHRYYFSSKDKHWRFRWVIWRGPAVETFFRSSCSKDVYLLDSVPLEEPLRKAKALLDMFENGGEPEPWQNAQDALSMLLPVLQQAQRSDLLGSDKAKTSSPNAVVDPILRDPSLSVDKQGWAESEGLSRYQLYRRVKAHTGMSPKDLRNRHRLKEAFRYLKKENLSVADAATLSGFSSQTYFARFFKKRTGFSPTEWRKLFASQ